LSKENVAHVGSSDSNSGNLGSGSSSTLEGLYQALPKRRKVASVDAFGPILEPKFKKSNTKAQDFFGYASPTSPLFDEASPFFLTHENLEPTDQPLVPQQNGMNETAHPPDYVLPKIPSRIRWDNIRNLYVSFFSSLFPLTFFKIL
jgi:hypothetical protein